MSRPRQLARTGLLALVLALALDASIASAGAAVRTPARARAVRVARSPGRSRRSAQPPAGGVARAPGGPPLSVAGPAAEAAEEGAGQSVAENADPLVSNGLDSPLCRGELGEGGLSTAALKDCATSGFSGSAAPTGNYGLDVHIDTGVLGLSYGGLMSVVQDLLITPVWMALVWIVHALCVMLEWCFTLDLLDSPAAGGIGRGLRQMQAALTDPWLATVLSVACVLVLYDGLIRRRVAETVGQALLMSVMVLAGMWTIADPSGTVGALSQWANQASLGTLAVAAQGAPADSARVLGDSMQAVFATAIGVPWCYLEFGNVAWCREPGGLILSFAPPG